MSFPSVAFAPSRHRMREICLASMLLGVAWLAWPSSAEAQLRYGGHFARAQDAFGGTGGIGARVGLGLPLLPVEGFASGEYFFPACAAVGGCALSGVSLDMNVRLPMVLLSPYATGGWVLRRLDPGGGGDTLIESGLHLGLGVGAGVPGARVFGEARYEFIKVPSRQLVLRLGILVGG